MELPDDGRYPFIRPLDNNNEEDEAEFPINTEDEIEYARAVEAAKANEKKGKGKM